MVRRRGDNIPSISDYSHWGEEASIVWYQENRYDMEHADEIIDDDDFEPDDGDEDFNESQEFDTEQEARTFFESLKTDANMGQRRYNHKWYVEW